MEQELFGATLELQTVRAKGGQLPDPAQVADAIDQIGKFWSNPEEMTDEEVANTAVRIRALLQPSSNGGAG